MSEPVRPLTIGNPAGDHAVFCPQADMTGCESALCSQLFWKAYLSPAELDWRAYLSDHRLWRHFVEGSSDQPKPDGADTGDAGAPDQAYRGSQDL